MSFRVGFTCVVGLLLACGSGEQGGPGQEAPGDAGQTGGRTGDSAAPGADRTCPSTCFRAIVCVNVCGGPVVSSGCCACEAPAFDRDVACSTDGSIRPPEAGGDTGAVPSEAGVDLSHLHDPCRDDGCPAGLTAVRYYGIAGPSGPEFCSCEIPCAKDPLACPGGTSCVQIADGPGSVCSN